MAKRLVSLFLCLAAGIGAWTASAQQPPSGWTEAPAGGVTTTPDQVGIGVSSSETLKIFTVKALNNVTGNVDSLASLGNKIIMLDVGGSAANEKTAIAAAFGTGATLPAAIVFAREGTRWGTSLGFYTHNDDIVALDQMAERLHITATGRVGIGTATPNGQFHVANANPGNSVYSVFERGTAGPDVSILIRTASAMSGDWWMGKTGGQGETLFFQYGNPPTPRVAFWGNGNVGIGTGVTAPRAMLDVMGNIYAQGTISGSNVVAHYQDIAEWVPSTSNVPPGTVVVINPDGENEVMASAKAYDTAVAGVVSSQPGVILGEEGAEKEQVATTGRVKVRVDATRMPIRVGDLLVTSDVAGVAMRSEPIDLHGTKIHRPGTVIGKALQPLASGQGEILVLLSLQ